MDVPSSLVFFLWWCIVHCLTEAQEKTVLSHILLQNLPHLWAKQSLYNSSPLFIVAAPKTLKNQTTICYFFNLKKQYWCTFTLILKNFLYQLIKSSFDCRLILSHPAWGAFPRRSKYPGHISPTLASSSKLRIQATSTKQACPNAERHRQQTEYSTWVPPNPVFKSFVEIFSISKFR